MSAESFEQSIPENLDNCLSFCVNIRDLAVDGVLELCMKRQFPGPTESVYYRETSEGTEKLLECRSCPAMRTHTQPYMVNGHVKGAETISYSEFEFSFEGINPTEVKRIDTQQEEFRARAEEITSNKE